MSNKELTATQFNKDPAQFYRAAYDGETVTISHDHYGQGLFELTYRKRGFKPDKKFAHNPHIVRAAPCDTLFFTCPHCDYKNGRPWSLETFPAAAECRSCKADVFFKPETDQEHAKLESGK